MTTINHNVFGNIVVELKGDGITGDNAWLIDIGDIRLAVYGREYQIDFADWQPSIEGDAVNVLITPNSFEEAQETFEDCSFDLTEADLLSPELEVTLFTGYSPEDNSDKASVEFISGFIETHLDGEIRKIAFTGSYK